MAPLPQGRKVSSTGNITRKTSPPTLSTATTSTPTPQSTTTAQTVTFEPKNARTHLELQGVLDKDAKLNFDIITVALLKTADDTQLSEESLRSRVRALAYVGQQYTTEFIAQQTVGLVADQVLQAQKLGRERAVQETEEVRQSLESVKSALTEEVSRLIRDKSSWLKATEDFASLKETVINLQTVVEEKNKETMEKMEQMKEAIVTATDEMRIDKHFAGGDPAAFQPSLGMPYSWSPFDTNMAGGPYSYAKAAALPTSAAQPDRESQLQQQTLDRLRESEEKKDRQLMLNAEDIGAGNTANLTETALVERIDKVIQELTSDPLYNFEDMGIVRCDKVTKLARGGLLILMNSVKAKEFLAQPDVSELFAEALGMTTKVIPRRFKVVIEKVPIETNLDDLELP
ncbi:hypothetical protein FRC11_011667 [Ceratobasidium sp. 423]|nr:hypothetical protein FRC11_011667 [Ceratobasidium sp. 423]